MDNVYYVGTTMLSSYLITTPEGHILMNSNYEASVPVIQASVKELGFDACVDYKAGNLLRDLEAACPKGVDVYFENVGGAVLDTVLRVMNVSSRIVLCGMVADYNATEPYGVKTLRSVLSNRIRMQGMIVFDWKDRYVEAIKALAGYLAQGKLKYRESVIEGLENAPRGLIGLLKGENFGKQLVKLA